MTDAGAVDHEAHDAARQRDRRRDTRDRARGSRSGARRPAPRSPARRSGTTGAVVAVVSVVRDVHVRPPGVQLVHADGRRRRERGDRTGRRGTPRPVRRCRTRAATRLRTPVVPPSAVGGGRQPVSPHAVEVVVVVVMRSLLRLRFRLVAERPGPAPRGPGAGPTSRSRRAGRARRRSRRCSRRGSSAGRRPPVGAGTATAGAARTSTAAAVIGGRLGRVGAGGGVELAPGAALGLQAAEAAEGHVAGDDPDPGLQHVDLAAPARVARRPGHRPRRPRRWRGRCRR